MNHHFLELSSILRLSWREIRNRFPHLFLLALIEPVVMWFSRGIIKGFDPLQLAEAEPSFWGALVSLVAVLISLWGLIALVLFVCKRANNFRELFILALKRLPRFVGGMLLYVLLTVVYIALSALLFVLAGLIVGFQGGGLLAIGVLGIILMAGLVALSVYFILLPYVLILTDISVWLALPAAYTLVKHNFWRTLGLLLILGLIGAGIYVLSLITLAFTAIILWFIWPGLRYILSFLFVIPMALVVLSSQIPLIAVYVDRIQLLRTNAEQADSSEK